MQHVCQRGIGENRSDQAESAHWSAQLLATRIMFQAMEAAVPAVTRRAKNATHSASGCAETVSSDPVTVSDVRVRRSFAQSVGVFRPRS